MTAVFSEQFEGLPSASRYAHLARIAGVAVAIVMLIAPAAYHRSAARGNAEQGVLDYAVRMMLLAEGLIALGVVGEALRDVPADLGQLNAGDMRGSYKPLRVRGSFLRNPTAGSTNPVDLISPNPDAAAGSPTSVLAFVSRELLHHPRRSGQRL